MSHVPHPRMCMPAVTCDVAYQTFPRIQSAGCKKSQRSRLTLQDYDMIFTVEAIGCRDDYALERPSEATSAPTCCSYSLTRRMMRSRLKKVNALEHRVSS